MEVDRTPDMKVQRLKNEISELKFNLHLIAKVLTEKGQFDLVRHHFERIDAQCDGNYTELSDAWRA